MPRRRRYGGIAFMAVWIVFWTAAIFIAVYAFGSEALSGDLAPALFLVVWVAAALFGLWRAAHTLVALLAGRADPPRRRIRQHEWKDGMPERNGADGRGDRSPPGS